MSAVEVANENSSLLSFLGSSAPKTSPFTYALRKNAPKYSKQRKVTVAKTSATSYGSEARFALPRYGILKSMHLSVAITPTANSESGPYGILGAFSRFDLKARDKTIATLYPETIVDWIKGHGPEARAVLQDDDHLKAQDDIAAVARTYVVPLPFSYTERLSNALNLRFTEPLELVVTMTSAAADWAVGNSATPTLTWVGEYLSPGAEELASLKQTMVKAGRAGIPRLQYSVYKEAVKDLSASEGTEQTIDLKCPYPAFRSVVVVKSKATGKPLDFTNIIGTVKLKASGTDLIEWTAAELREQANKDGFSYSFGQEQQGTLRAPPRCPTFGTATTKTDIGDEITTTGDKYVFADGMCTVTTDQAHGLLPGDVVHAGEAYGGGTETGTDLPVGTYPVLKVNSATVFVCAAPGGATATACDGTRTLKLISRANPEKHPVDMYPINYNLVPEGLDQTGLMSFKNLANPQIGITPITNGTDGATPSTSFDLEVYHYYYQIESTSADDGQVSVRALT